VGFHSGHELRHGTVILAQTAVHTTGINWPSVILIVCAIVGALAIIFGAIARYATKQLSRSTTDAINQFRIDVVAALVTRLTVVETKVDVLLNTKGRNKEND
jgi:hypothetical protein